MKSYQLAFFDGLSPAALMALIEHSQPNWHGFWLHNAGNDVIGLLPKTRWILSKNIASAELPLIITTHHRTGNTTQQSANLSDFEHILIAYHQQYAHHKSPHPDRYHHGLMGYISYDISANALNHRIAMHALPLAYFGHYDIYLAYVNSHWHLYLMDTAEAFCINYPLDELFNQLKKMAETILPTPTPIAFKPLINPSQYRTAFDRTLAYLNAGDAYQVNLTQAWQGASKMAITYWLPKLFCATKAPFSGYVRIDNFEVLSVSPELFFAFNQKNTDICLTTKPIKGTRPRSSDTKEDERLKSELAHSIKDVAENVMIVDLLRNDLGKYAKFGAVSVPVRFAIESFSNVHHMVSTVVATLGNSVQDTPIIKVLFDSLPAGSITGSPKKRACEIIHELEVAPRGAYCGTMGYLNFDNTGRWNVLIRTLQAWSEADAHQVRLWAGGGVTVLSDGDDEYQECLDKIQQIKAVLAQTPA